MTQACDQRIRLGPPVYYRPVWVRTRWGYIGGAWQYQKAETEEEANRGPIVIDQRVAINGTATI